MTKIFISDPLDTKAVEQLKNLGNVTMENDWDFDIVIVRSKTKVTAEFIDKTKNLKLVIRAGVGLDNIDLTYSKQKNVKVMNTPKSSTISVAELTLGLILACTRRIAEATASMKRGEWLKKQLRGTEIAEKTLGLIGYGRIGHEVAKRAIAFGMNVIVTDLLPVQGIKSVDLDTLLKEADIISLHIPSTKKTINLINKEMMAKMKDGVIIINASRGNVLNESDLSAALKSGKVKYAGLDVYSKEPPSEELVSNENIVLTPHIGANTTEAMAKIGAEVVQIVKDFISD